ncbi:MAG: PAS domain-containing protein [Blastochloris sp.]|nr:PAS domain-containing protein [Blastochloris sp.]
MVTLDGVLVEANRSALDWPLRNNSSLIGVNILDRLPNATDVQRVRAALEQVSRGEDAQLTIDFFTREGAYHAMAFVMRPYSDADGIVRYALITISDVTDYKQVQGELLRITEQLDAQRQRLRYILANVPGIVWEQASSPTDPMQRINFVSDYAERMLGYPREAWLTTPNFWSKIIEPEDQPSYFEQLAHIFANPPVPPLPFAASPKMAD